MRAKRVALVLAGVLAAYLVLLGVRGVALVSSGEPAGIGLGLGVLAVPFLCGWAVVREIRFGRQTEVLARALQAEGGLPTDELPRTPSGRVVREAADQAFERYRAQAEAAPHDWRSWFRLACAYDAARDRRRARRAMRHAIELHRSGPATRARLARP